MRWGVAAFVFLLIPAAALAALGIFRGKLVEPPAQEARAGWVFVQSPRGMLRKVEITKARITYGDDVPRAGRAASPSADLVPGAEVLVTAEQDDAGEWRATEIEIQGLSARPTHPRRPVGWIRPR